MPVCTCACAPCGLHASLSLRPGVLLPQAGRAVVPASCPCGALPLLRAVSSLCGSADVLEALGVAVELGPEGVARCIDEAGVGFMFAPTYHPAMKARRRGRLTG